MCMLKEFEGENKTWCYSYILEDLTLEHVWLILEYGLDSAKEFFDKCFS